MINIGWQYKKSFEKKKKVFWLSDMQEKDIIIPERGKEVSNTFQFARALVQARDHQGLIEV